MAVEVTSPRAEDVISVGSRINWGAILAGTVVALAMQFLLTVLGGAVGVSISDNVRAENLRMGAVIWTIVTACAALFVGGMVTSQLTVGENKVESMLYGIIMWALTLALVLALGAAGARMTWNATMGMANMAHATSSQSWEVAARNAGVPGEQIDEWKRKASTTRQQGESKGEPQVSAEAAKRITWYAFGGIWGSMLAAVIGAVVGAGPVFRIVRTT